MKDHVTPQERLAVEHHYSRSWLTTLIALLISPATP